MHTLYRLIIWVFTTTSEDEAQFDDRFFPYSIKNTTLRKKMVHLGVSVFSSRHELAIEEKASRIWGKIEYPVTAVIATVCFSYIYFGNKSIEVFLFVALVLFFMPMMMAALDNNVRVMLKDVKFTDVSTYTPGLFRYLTLSILVLSAITGVARYKYVAELDPIEIKNGDISVSGSIVAKLSDGFILKRTETDEWLYYSNVSGLIATSGSR